MGNNNLFKLSDIYTEIHYDYKCVSFSKRPFGGNEMDT